MNTEHVDIGLARFSDWAFTSSVVVLVAAMVLLAVELAYSRSRKVESAELVGAAVGGWAAFISVFAGAAVAGAAHLGGFWGGVVAGAINGAINGAAAGFVAGYASLPIPQHRARTRG